MKILNNGYHLILFIIGFYFFMHELCWCCNVTVKHGGAESCQWLLKYQENVNKPLLLCIIFSVWWPRCVGGKVLYISVLRVILVRRHGTPWDILRLGTGHVLTNTVVQTAECHKLLIGESLVLDYVLNLKSLAFGETVGVKNSLALTLKQAEMA